jgi:hypothetical protein
MRLIRAFSDALRRHAFRRPARSVMLRIVVAGLLIGCSGAAAAQADDGLDSLRAAAEQGDAAAQYKLGTRYLGESDGAARRGATIGREEDNQEAIKWLRLAGEHGNIDAQARLGVLYAYGGVVARDPAEAAKWTRLAAEQGNRNAMLRLAEMYSLGRGVPRDPAEAKRWYQRHNASAPRKVDRQGLLLAAIGLTTLAFGAALMALQSGALAGWKKSAATVFVHLVGPLFVLDSLLTYTPWFLMNCGHGYLDTHCTQIADPGLRSLLNGLGDFQMVNLVFRFMALVGFSLDLLAGWYLVYVWSEWIRARRQKLPV